MADTYKSKTAEEWFETAMALAKTLDEERRATYEHQQRYKEGLEDVFALHNKQSDEIIHEVSSYGYANDLLVYYDNCEVVTRKVGEWQIVKKAPEEDL